MERAIEKTMDKWYGKLKHEAVKIKRQAKAIAEVETPFEKNLREATSNRKWGCPNSVLLELAADAQSYKYRQKIMQRTWENLQGNQEKWRRILKTLIMVEYLLKNGTEQILPEVQSEQMCIRRLTSYQCKEDGLDRGTGVREKAECLLKLLNDKELLKTEREQAKQHRAKLHGNGSTSVSGGGRGHSSSDGFGHSGSGFSSGRGNISSSQASELNSRFDRLKQQQQQERAAREKDFRFNDDERDRDGDSQERRRQDDNRNRDSPRDNRPQQDSYGLFDPSFRPSNDSGSDSDRGPIRRKSDKNSKAPPQEDLLDLGFGGDDPAAPGAAADINSMVDWGTSFDSTPQPVPAPAAASSSSGFKLAPPPPPPSTSAIAGTVSSAAGGNLMDFMADGSADPQPTTGEHKSMDLFDGSDFNSGGYTAGGSQGQSTNPFETDADFASFSSAPPTMSPAVDSFGMSSSSGGYPTSQMPIASQMPAQPFVAMAAPTSLGQGPTFMGGSSGASPAEPTSMAGGSGFDLNLDLDLGKQASQAAQKAQPSQDSLKGLDGLGSPFD
eukprot:TRINITY_DN3746_c9_g1_i1.p1 TRINITY_DN3746_c9_g1~~TRINITY_DN3746_c9_g1_i1.p1  ORF type:complete len:585 (-),score=148.85 TRINITY_DN3746_c9_g1_i1:66-1727(-)